MPDIPNESGQNSAKVISETVAFRYSNEADLQFIGEAELVIEILGNQADAGTNLYSVRVDIISLYDSEGDDVFTLTINDRILQSALEKIALDHYFHPPKVPIGLPKRADW